MKQSPSRHVLRNVSSETRVLDLVPQHHRYEVTEFQPLVHESLERICPDFDIVKFDKSICWSLAISKSHKPDLVMVSKDRRSWVIVEVEFSTHELGYSYSDTRSGGHIYHQVETFADGDYNTDHIAYLAKKMGVSAISLEPLNRAIPEVLVVGDNKDVLYASDEHNWKRLLEIGDHVHLGFLESFEDEHNPTDTCVVYDGWIPTQHHHTERLRSSPSWGSDSLTGFSDAKIGLPEGEVDIYVEGVLTKWKHLKQFNILRAHSNIAAEYLKRGGDGAIYEIRFGEVVELEIIE